MWLLHNESLQPRLIIGVLSAAILGCNSPPSDQALIAEFRDRRADYNTLLSMFRADSSLGRIAYDFTRPANFFSRSGAPESAPVTSTRLAQYREIFDRLSLTAGVEGYDQKHIVYFWRYTEGMGAGPGGASKGFAYSDSLPADRATAEGCVTRRDDCWQLRPIGGGWFVIEEHHN